MCLRPSRVRAPRRTSREGGATIEFALVGVLFVFLLLGMIEVARGLLVKETLTNAARAAARIGAIPGGSTAAATRAAQGILSEGGVDPARATILVLVNGQAKDVTGAARDDRISVKVSVPASAVSWTVGLLLTGRTVESETFVMLRQ